LLYFITDGEYLKIGFSSAPHLRLKTLQTGNARFLDIVFCINGPNWSEGEYKIHERLAHEYFRAHHERGEWHRLEGDLKKWVYFEIQRRKAVMAENRKRKKRGIEDLFKISHDITAWSSSDGFHDLSKQSVDSFISKMISSYLGDGLEIDFNFKQFE